MKRSYVLTLLFLVTGAAGVTGYVVAQQQTQAGGRLRLFPEGGTHEHAAI